jgi:hypothetical protein
MAEFKLGRIKFVYQGAWQVSFAYVVDDVVTVGGKTYICTVSNTSSALFATDLASSYWSIVADGSRWTGNWATNTYYQLGDQVLYGGIVYLCTTAHTSSATTALGLEANQANWTAFASSFNWAGAWTVNTRYKLNDLVSYGGYTYVCNAYHTSAATTALGLEANQASWTTFNAGISYQGAWSGSSVHYRLNDIVKYGASIWICTLAHNSTSTFSGATNWSVFVNGLEYVSGGWSSATAYVTGDIVNYGGNLYIASQNNTNQIPSVVSSTYWSLFTSGFNFLGDWSNATTYKIGSVVRQGGYTYLATADNGVQTVGATATATGTNQITISGTTAFLTTGLPIQFTGTVSTSNIVVGTVYFVQSVVDTTHFIISATSGGSAFALGNATVSLTGTTNPQPPFGSYWTRLNSGIRWNPTTAVYSAVSGTNITGTGTGAKFDITANKTVYTVTVTSGQAGTGYAATNTIKILGTAVGGLSPANDITITVTGVTSGAITTLTNTGYSVSWGTGVTYVLGDTVYFGANSYICIAAHVSAAGNRPDADTAGAYWNILASGAESAVLTTQGDTFYYGATGPTRLPIGSDGQVLRVSTNVPSWAYYGQINNVVYVGPNGADSLGNSQGTTIDKPWASIRYACSQIENGYLNTNATALLQLNKQFLLKEINNYVYYQYSFNVTGTATTVITVGGSSTVAQTTTANMYAGMPIVFTTSSGSIVAGTVYYVYQILSPTTFNIVTTVTGTNPLAVGTGSANIGTYYYLQAKTERDTGIIVDALIYDIGRSGTFKTTTATQAYFATSTTYASGVNASDITPFVSALNYLSTLATTVLNNTAPGTNYQSLISPSVSITGVANNGGSTATLTFGAQPVVYPVGSQITVAGVSVAGYNGIYTVISATSTTVTYANTTTSAATGGTVTITKATQQINTTYTAEAAGIAKVPTLISIITGPLQVGNTNALVPAQTPNTTIFVKTGTYNEILPIVVPAYTSVIGDELRGTVTQPQSAIINLANDKPKWIASLTRVQSLLPNIISNTTVTATAGNTQYLATTGASGTGTTATITFATQTTAPFIVGQFITVSGVAPSGYNGSYIVTAVTTSSVSYANSTSSAQTVAGVVSSQVTGLPAGDIGNTTAVNTINTSTQLINNMIYNGLSQTPAFVIPQVQGYNTTFLAGHSYGVTQITNNYLFIKAELAAYLNTNYSAIWASLGSAGQQTYLLQIQFILDGLQYDMAYGCNNQSIVNGSSYYSLSINQISATNQPAYLAAFNRLQTIISQIVTSTTVTVSSGNTVTQSTGGTAGSAAAAAFAAARIGDVIYWFNNGVANSATNTITGSISGTTLTVTASTSTIAIGSFLSGTGIAGQVIVNQITSSASANASPTYTSGGAAGASSFVVSLSTGIASGQLVTGTGIPTGTYVSSTYAGSTTVPLVNAFGAPALFTVQAAGTYNFYAPGLAGTYTLSTTGGTGTSFVTYATFTPILSGAYGLVNSSTLQNSFNLLQARQSEIAADAQAFVYKYNQAYNISATLSNRDAGYITAALSYDVLFGTNFNSIVCGRAFNRSNTSALAVVGNVSNELYATTSAITFIGFKAKQYAAAGSQVQAQTLIDDIVTKINGQALFTTVGSANINGVQTIAYGTGDTITVTTGGGTATFTPTLTASTGGLTITSITSAGAATFSTAQTLLKGTSVVVASASGGMSPGTYYVTTGVSSSFIVTLSTSYANAVAGTPGAFTGGIVAGAVSAVTVGSSYNNVASVAVLSGGNWTNTTAYASAQSTTTTSSGQGLTLSLSFTASSYSTTLTTATTSTNVLTVGSTSGMATNMPITFTGLTAPYTTTATATFVSSNLITLSGVAAVATGQQIYFTGAVFGNIVPNQMYYITSLSGNNITVSLTYGGSAVTLVSASGTMNVTVNLTGGLWNNNTYWINTIPSGTTLTVTNSFKSNTAYTITNTVNSLTAQVIAGAVTTWPYLNNPMINGTLSYNDTLTTIQGSEILRANIPFLVAEAAAYTLATYGGTVASVTTGSIINTSGNHNLTIGDPVVFTGTVGSSNIVAGTQYWVLTTPSLTSFTITTTQISQGAQTTFTLSNATLGSLTVNYYFNTTNGLRDLTNFINAIIYDLNYTGNYKSMRIAELYTNGIQGSQTQNFYLVRNSCGVRNQTMNGLTGTLGAPNAYGTRRPTAGAYTSLDAGFGPNDSNSWIYGRSTFVQNCTMFGYACSGAKVDGALHAGGYRSMVANDYTCVIGDGIGWWNTGSGSLAELVSVFNYYCYAGYMSELGGRIRATNGNSSYGVYGCIAETVDTFEAPIFGNVNNRAYGAQVTQVITDSTTQILRLEFQNAGSSYTNAIPTVSGAGYNILTFQDEFRDAGVFETRLIDLNNGQGVGGSSYVSVVNVGQTNTLGVGYHFIAAADNQVSGLYNGMHIQITAGTGVGQYANILTYTNSSKVAQIIRPTFATLTVTGSSTTALTVASTVTLYVGMPIYLSATTAGTLSAYQVYYVQAITSTTQFTVALTSGGSAITGLTATSGQTISLYAAGWDHVVPGTVINNITDLTSAYIIEPAITYTGPGYTATGRTLPGTATTWSSVTYGAGNFVATTTNNNQTGISTNGKNWSVGSTLPSTNTWSNIVYGGGQGAAATIALGGFGGSGAVLTAQLGTGVTANQVVSVTVVNGGYNYTTPPTIQFVGTGVGAAAIATVLNGVIQSVTVTVNGSGYSSAPTTNVVTTAVSSITPVSWGKNYFNTPTVTISAPFSGTVWSSGGSATGGQYYYYFNTSAQVTNYYLCNSSGTFSATAPIFTTGTQTLGVSLTYVGTQATVTPVMLDYGVSSYTIVNAGLGYSSVPTVTITDLTAKFVAITSSTTATAYVAPSSITGSTWASGNLLPSANFISLAYGNNVYVAVGGSAGVGVLASSGDGINWSSQTPPSGATTVVFSSVAYGWTGPGPTLANTGGSTTRGMFVAITTNSNVTVYSTNGTTWILGGTLPSSTTWSSITYGNGRFVAVAAGGTSVAYSINGGITWYASTNGGGAGLPVSQNWSNVGYGEGQFFATATGPTPTLTATSSTGNLITLSSSSGLSVGNTITPTAVTQTTSASTTTHAVATSWTTAFITSNTGVLASVTQTSGQLSFVATTPVALPVGTAIAVTGTATGNLAGVTTGTTYYVSSAVTPTTTAVTLTTSLSFANAGTNSITLTGSTSTGLTFTYTTPNLYLVATNAVGSFAAGMALAGSNVASGTYIQTGNTFATTGSSISGTTLTIGTLSSGTIIPNMVLTGVQFTNTNGYIVNNYYPLGASVGVFVPSGTTTGTISTGSQLSGTGYTTGATYINTALTTSGATITGTNALGTAVTFTASIAATGIMTVTTAPTGAGINIGHIITGGSVTANSVVVIGNISGTPTSASSTWYVTSTSSFTQTSTTLTATPAVVTVTGTVPAGTLIPGMSITGTGVGTGAFITAQVTSTSGTVGTSTYTSGGALGAFTFVQSGNSGTIQAGQLITGTGILNGTYVVSLVSNTITISQPFYAQASGAYTTFAAGGLGTYEISNATTFTSQTLTGTAWTVNTNALIQPTSVTGQIAAYIVSNLSGSGNGSTWTINTPLTVSASAIGGQQWTVSQTQTGVTATTITGTNDLVTIGSTLGMQVGEPIVFTGTIINTTLTGTASSGNLLTVGTTVGMAAGAPITFGQVTQSGTSTYTNSSGNLINVGNNTNMVPGETIVFTAVTQTPTLTATTNNTASIVATISTASIVFAGSISGTTLTVTSVTSGTLSIGTMISGGSIQPGTFIVSNLSGTGTGASTWTVNISQNTLGATTGTYTTLNVTTLSSGTIAIGQTVGSPATAGTYIVANISGTGNGSVWAVSIGQTVGSLNAFTLTGNIITLSSTTGLTVGESFIPATTVGGLTGTSTYYITEVISATNQIAVATSYGATTNLTLTTTTSQSVATLCGSVFGNLVSGNTYYILTLPTSSHTGADTITISSSYGGTTFTIANGNAAWTYVAGGSFGGLSSGTTYYVNAIVSPGVGGTITISTSYLGSVLAVTNGNGSWTAVEGASLGGLASGTPYFITEVIGSTQVAVSTAFAGTNYTLSSGAGSWSAQAGAILGNLISGNTYYIASISGNQITVSTSSTLTPAVVLVNDTGSWTSTTGNNVAATSWDGINWVQQSMPALTSWGPVVFGNPQAANVGYNPIWVTVSTALGTQAASIHTGATPYGRAKVTANALSEIRLIEPGSGFAKGNVTATTASTNIISVDNTENLQALQPVEFNTVSSGGLSSQITYYVIGSSITSNSFQVAATSALAVLGTAVNLTTSAPTGMIYTAGPIVTITDPNRVNNAPVRVRTSDGVLGNPSFANRGSGNSTATGSYTGDGYSDIYQNTQYLNISNLYTPPAAGSNVQFSSIPNTWYKLVQVTNLLGVSGNYTATFQISPSLSTYYAPSHNVLITTRLKYSQVRLTGHDFLYVGTGNQTQTNYPNVNPANAIAANQTLPNIGGRVFFTSTDQDGNFNVGNLFGVQQATGTASLNANAFNLAGLQSLTLGAVSIGVGSATVTQFSTDPYFTANSDNVVPTQKAIKSFITAQIGGGSSSLNVNTLTSGQIFIANNSISNTNGTQIYVSSKMYFAGGIDGAPVAWVFFGQR